MEEKRQSTSSIPDHNECCTNVVFMGSARVGKTSIIQRILRVPDPAAVTGKYVPTIEDSYVQRFLVGELCCQLRLVDTTGSYMFPAMQRLWVRKASAFVLVCARDDIASLEQIRNLIACIREERPDECMKLPLVLVVNKCDIHLQEWKVSDEEVEFTADELSIPYNSIVFTSAKTDNGITELMKNLWRQNEEIGGNTVVMEPVPIGKRRSSAFANFFGGSSSSRRSSGNQVNGTGRSHTGSVSETLPENSPRQSISPRMSKPEIFLAKTINKLHIGQEGRRRQSKSDLRSKQTLIEFDCSIS